MAKLTLTRHRLRCALDAATYGDFRDVLTSAKPQMWKGNPTVFEVGLFSGLPANGQPGKEEQIIDLTGFESFTLEVKASKVPNAANLMAKTIALADCDNTLTVDSWNGFAAADGAVVALKQHILFAFTDAESNIDAGTWPIVISGIGPFGPITFDRSELLVTEDQTPGDAEDPAENPGAAISMAQADLRYQTVIPDGPYHKWGTIDLVADADHYAIAFATPFATGHAPTLINVSLMVPGASSPVIEARADLSTVLVTGCTARFTSAAVTGYRLCWEARRV